MAASIASRATYHLPLTTLYLLLTMIGGIFIKANNPKFLARWYEDNLGIGFGTGIYFSFKWRDLEKTDDIGYTAFSFFPETTEYFSPSNNDSMLNLRVDNLETTRELLKNNGVEVESKVESYDYGRFGWAIDCDGRKIELWEPVDKAFDDYHKPMELFEKVTGLGGVFLKSKNVQESVDWYSKNFGMDFSYSFSNLQWRDVHQKETICNTVFSFFAQETKYFGKSTKDFMLNFRVKNLDEILHELRSSEIEVDEKVETYDYGKFGWIYDPEGNRIELWEPIIS